MNKSGSIIKDVTVVTINPWETWTHLPWTKRPPFCRRHFLWVFSWKEMYEFRLRFHGNCPKGRIDNNPALVYILAWCRIGGKPLFEAMLTQFTDAYMRHWGRWVEVLSPNRSSGLSPKHILYNCSRANATNRDIWCHGKICSGIALMPLWQLPYGVTRPHHTTRSAVYKMLKTDTP